MAAAGLVQNTADHDRILRQMTDVDYGQWQRTRTPSAQSTPVLVGQRPKPGQRPSSGLGSEARLSSAGRRGLASACRQIWAGGRNAKDENKAERMRLIQLRIQARKRTISDYKIRCGELIQLNQKLRNAIEKEESGVHREVKSLLRKYEKFRGGVSLLNSKFSQDFSHSSRDLEATRKKVDNELKEMRYKVNILDEELQVKQKELNILSNYKDKEYPVRTIEMNDLRKEMETLSVVQDDEQEELETIIGAELKKMHSIRDQIRTTIIAGVTEEFLEQMHPSLQDMALQNLVMKKEIDFHKKEIEMLTNSNRELEKKVNALKVGNETNVRMTLFPQLYPLKPICTPETEVVLNIPRQEWLPI